MKSRRHPAQIPAIVLLALAVLFAIAFSVALVVTIRWVRGAEFHRLVEEESSKALGGRAEFGTLDWLWLGVSSSKVSATGGGTTPIREFEAGNVRAKLDPSSLLKGFWGIEEIVLDRARLRIGPSASSAAAVSPVTEPEHAGSGSSSLPSWIPTALVVQAIRSGNTDIVIDTSPDKAVEILGTRIAAFPEKSGTRIESSGGTLRWTRFPDFVLNIGVLRGRLTDGRFRLNGGDLSFPSGGTAGLEGDFPDERGVFHLEAHWDSVPVGEVLPAAKETVTGMLSGEGHATWGAGQTNTVEGRVNTTDVTLANLPVLGALADFTGMEQFRKPVIQRASASFSKAGEETRWDSVEIESQGLLKLTGNANIGGDGSLQGDFQLGVTTDIVRVLPLATTLLGAQEKEGYLWMPLHVGGTLSHPTEDLSARLVTAIAAKASGVVRDGLDAGLKILGGLTTNAPASLPEGATNAVKTLEQGAGSAIDAAKEFLK